MGDFSNRWLSLADRFYRVAFYLLESEQDAEDAVQELYLKLWSARNTLEGIQNPAAYGISLLKHICIDRIRKRMVRKAEPLEKAPLLEGDHSESRKDMKDTLRYLLEEIEKLPDKQRMVLKMRAIDGLEYDDISRQTGLSKVHVRVLITMARKTLKQKIDI